MIMPVPATEIAKTLHKLHNANQPTLFLFNGVMNLVKTRNVNIVSKQTSQLAIRSILKMLDIYC